ncbi:MAG: hypothetical protein HYX96_01700 [Chloroflexi bacterium]|nr:hypothetical protein [Chloroflexota bacterium]
MLSKLRADLRKFVGGIIGMPDFTEIEWEGYLIKLRAADYARRFIAGIGLFDIMPYYESSDIGLAG